MHGGTMDFEQMWHEFMQNDLSESNGAGGALINQMILQRYHQERQICHQHRIYRQEQQIRQQLER